MTSPLYFVIDTLDLTSPPYSLMAFSAPAPQLEAETAAALEYQPDNSAWSRDQHDASVITATVKISGVSEADALAAVNAIVKSAHSDAIAYAQQSAQTARAPVAWCRMRACSSLTGSPQFSQGIGFMVSSFFFR